MNYNKNYYNYYILYIIMTKPKKFIEELFKHTTSIRSNNKNYFYNSNKNNYFKNYKYKDNHNTSYNFGGRGGWPYYQFYPEYIYPIYFYQNYDIASYNADGTIIEFDD